MIREYCTLHNKFPSECKAPQDVCARCPEGNFSNSITNLLSFTIRPLFACEEKLPRETSKKKILWTSSTHSVLRFLSVFHRCKDQLLVHANNLKTRLFTCHYPYHKELSRARRLSRSSYISRSILRYFL